MNMDGETPMLRVVHHASGFTAGPYGGDGDPMTRDKVLSH